MNSKELSVIRKTLREQNKNFPKEKLVRVSQADFPEMAQGADNAPYDAWRSRDFLVLLFKDSGMTRLSICKTEVQSDGRWQDGITWDELFMLKCAAGFEFNDCVEIYPSSDHYVNVSNMRHLWVMDEPLPYKWTNQKTEADKCVETGCDGRILNDAAHDKMACDKCGKEYLF